VSAEATSTGRLRLATRSSPLAIAQVQLVVRALADVAAARSRDPRPVEVVGVVTSGDARRDVPIHSIGGRGVFVKEVDESVLSGAADAGVHSAKDLPSRLPAGIAIGAFLTRADPRDALVGSSLGDLPAGAMVASGSVRRRAQLAWLRPDLRFRELRGNVATRLGKVPPRGAVVLALAGLERLSLGGGAHALSPAEMLPQVGQGAIAVCCRRDDAATRSLLEEVDDEATRAAVAAERAFLRAVGGGCDSPLGALARPLEGGCIRLEAMVASLDGHVLVRGEATGTEPEELGERLAEDLLERRGGRMLLERSGGR
jgi:hydroxymethylbilane synthase